MKPNADCTIFSQQYNPTTRKNDWIKTFISGVYWQGSIGSKNNKSGMVQDNETIVFIPFSAVSEFSVKPEDKIVRGATTATTPVDLDGALTVTGIDTFDYGSPDMQHWEVTAK